MWTASRRTHVRNPRIRRTAAYVLVAMILCALGTAAEPAGEPDFRVIVDPQSSMTSAPREVIAGAFLKVTTRWPDGEFIRPVDQRPGAAARKAFSQNVLRRSVGAVRSYWQQRIFSGRDVPPPELESDDAVVRFVSEHRGAIGYVSPAAPTGATKIVAIK